MEVNIQNSLDSYGIIDIFLNLIYNVIMEMLMLNSHFWALTDQKEIEY